jgi:hypothetical protein
MHFERYTDVHAFYRDTFDVLMRHESQNMIILGNLIMGHKGEDKTDWRDPANWLMATVSDASGIRLTALMTPPHNLTLYATDNRIDPAAIDCLIEGLEGHDIPGVITEKALAESFAGAYAARKGLTRKTIMDQRIYELTAVNPGINLMGTVRLLDENDMHFFPYWLEAFHAAGVYGKTEMSIPQNEDLYRYRLSTKKLYVLEVDGMPVCMAGYTRELPSAIGVAFVYTPSYFRRKGYATSCVAQLSQMALDKGYAKCVLYTDLLNPTSNGIYQKIGYKAVCDSLMLKFE